MVVRGRNNAVEGIATAAIARHFEHRREVARCYRVIGLVVSDLLGHLGASEEYKYDCPVIFFNGFFPSPGAWGFRHIPAQGWAALAVCTGVRNVPPPPHLRGQG